MKYRRMPIELESPEEFGYGNIQYNLAESSVKDGVLKNLPLELSEIVLCYGDHRGKPELRELIASESEGLAREHVLITSGAVMALFIVNTSLLKHGDHMIVAHPNYVSNIETPRAIGAEVEFLELTFDNQWRLDVDKLAKMIQPGTKLVSLTSPHNPTGAVIPEKDLRKVIELVEERGCYLLFDETYREMTFGEPLPAAALLSKYVISVSSMSKSFGLPGIRIGWLLCRDAGLMETFLAAKEQMVICNSVMDEDAAYRVLKRKEQYLEQYRIHIKSGFEAVAQWMDEQDILEWVRPSGGVVCFPRIIPEVNIDMDKFYKILLEDYKTFVGPGHWFEMDKRFMRIGYAWAELDDLRTGLKCISNALEDTAV